MVSSSSSSSTPPPSFDMNAHTDVDSLILYNFPPLTLKMEKIKNKMILDTSNFSVPSSSTTEHLVYTTGGTSTTYSLETIQIYKKPTNTKDAFTILNVDYDGILYCKYKSSSNFITGYVYTVFLLKTKETMTANAIDAILTDINTNNKTTIERILDLNSIIPHDQTAGCIVTGYNHHFIFVNPIQIKTKFIDLTGLKLEEFSSSDIDYKNYSVIPNENINKEQTSNKDGNSYEEDQIYIDCNPSGVSEETIETYNLPINSGLLKTVERDELIKMIVYFCFFLVGVMICYFAIPVFSNYITMIEIKPPDATVFNIPFLQLNENATNAGPYKGNKLHYYVLAILYAFVISCITFGFVKNDPIISAIGLLFLTLSILSIAQLSGEEYTYQSLLGKKGIDVKVLDIRENNQNNFPMMWFLGSALIIYLLIGLIYFFLGNDDKEHKVFVWVNNLLIFPIASFAYVLVNAKKET